MNQCICTDCLLAFVLVQHGKIVAQDTVFYQVVGERRTARGLELSYAYGRPCGRIPQSLPRGRFGGELRQLHLSAAWTSHNTPAFDFAAAHSN